MSASVPSTGSPTSRRAAVNRISSSQENAPINEEKTVRLVSVSNFLLCHVCHNADLSSVVNISTSLSSQLIHPNREIEPFTQLMSSLIYSHDELSNRHLY